MSIRLAKNRLTGTPARAFEVVLGQRQDGTRGATLHVNRYPPSHVPFTDPEQIEKLIEELRVAQVHLS